MIKVARTSTPNSLGLHAARWTSDLLAQIQAQGSYAKVSDTFKNRYRQDDVKTALETMYGEKCCYCESGVGANGYVPIEHRKPKAVFHDRSFEWENLHWSCNGCNGKKLNKWEAQAPILDPTVDDPEDHLEFDLFTCLAFPKTPRGQTTIDHAGLNRERLVRARIRTRDQALRWIDQFKQTTSRLDEQFYKTELNRMIQNNPSQGDIAEYSMLIKKIIQRYL